MLKLSQPNISEAAIAAMVDVIRSGQLVQGPENEAFEKDLARYLGCEEVLLVSSGTAALHVALLALDIGPGDAVFVPSFTFAATAEVVALAGASPVFVDIDPETYNIDIDSLQAAIAAVREKGELAPKAIIPVDLFGLAADYSAISRIAAREGLFVIEDAAQATGGSQGNTMCGAFGDVAGTSFYPAKPLGCYGDGGAMFTNDGDLAEILRSVAFHGKGQSQYDNVRIGVNSRLDTMQAAILIEKLAILSEEMELRQKVAARYSEALGDVVKVPAIPSGNRSAWAQYAIETPARDKVRAALKEEGIPSVVYYEKPLHLQEAYAAYPRAPKGLEVSETLPERILCLPMHPYLSEADQDRVVATIRSAVK